MRRGESGFSLVELAAAMIVGAATLAALWISLGGALRTDAALVEKAADARAAAEALEVLQSDLRLLEEVEPLPGPAGSLPPGVVAEDFLRARTAAGSISWRLEGGRILRNAGGRDRALGRNVAGFRVERRGSLLAVRIHGAERMGGLLPAWSASAAAAVRLEGAR